MGPAPERYAGHNARTGVNVVNRVSVSVDQDIVGQNVRTLPAGLPVSTVATVFLRLNVPVHLDIAAFTVRQLSAIPLVLRPPPVSPQTPAAAPVDGQERSVQQMWTSVCREMADVHRSAATPPDRSPVYVTTDTGWQRTAKSVEPPVTPVAGTMDNVSLPRPALVYPGSPGTCVDEWEPSSEAADDKGPPPSPSE